eukprot:10103261-Lingulodinium_polyedra.AAC.1
MPRDGAAPGGRGGADCGQGHPETRPAACGPARDARVAPPPRRAGLGVVLPLQAVRRRRALLNGRPPPEGGVVD